MKKLLINTKEQSIFDICNGVIAGTTRIQKCTLLRIYLCRKVDDNEYRPKSPCKSKFGYIVQAAL